MYDFTGFARKFYTSEAFEIIAVTVVAALIGLAFLLFHGEVITDRVALNVFAPNHIIEILDLLMAAVLSAILLTNVWRCVKLIMGEKLYEIPPVYYAKKAVLLVFHTVTQFQFSKCTDRVQWIIHLLIMTGYSSVF